jgi:hypothetical protein
LSAPVRVRPRAAAARGDWPLFVVLLAWPVLLVAPTGSPMSDSVLLAAIRLVDDHTFTLSDERDPTIVLQTEAFDISVRDGRVYSGVGPGATLLAAPFYRAVKPVLARFDESVITNRRFLGYYAPNRRRLQRDGGGHLKDVYLLQILVAWLITAPLLASVALRMYRCALARGLDAERGIVIAVSFALGTMALYYSATYSRPALAYGLAFHAVLSLLGTPERPRPGAASCLAAGSFLGIAIATDYGSAILVALTLLFVVPRLSAVSRLQLVLPLLTVLAATGWYHRALFGSPFATPYHFRFYPSALPRLGVDLTPFRENPAVQIHPPSPAVMLQLCAGSYKGLFLYSPVLLLGLAGHVRGLREERGRWFHLYCLGVFASYLTFNATLGRGDPASARLVWGGLSTLWGPRHLYATLPFLACGLVAVRTRDRPARALAWVLLLAACVLNVLGAMFSDLMMSASAFSAEAGSPLRFVLRLAMVHGARVPLLAAHGVPAPAQWVAVLALVVATVLVCRRELRGRRG